VAIPGGKAWQYLEEQRGNIWRKGEAITGVKTWQYLDKRHGNTRRKGVEIPRGRFGIA
jgi:hypothetical protein